MSNCTHWKDNRCQFPLPAWVALRVNSFLKIMLNSSGKFSEEPLPGNCDSSCCDGCSCFEIRKSDPNKETFSYEGPAGEDIATAIQHALTFSIQLQEPVKLEFNGITLLLYPDADPVAVQKAYFEQALK